MKTACLVSILAALVAYGAPAHAQQGGYDPAAAIRAQAAAMAPLKIFDGAWRGPATVQIGGGKTLMLTQTERVGPLLDGSVRVVEGRGHDAAGAVKFNAFGILSYNLQTKAYSMHAYAQGHADDFPVELLADGFAWTMAAGPGATIRYTARIEQGEWHETGERLADGQPPVRIFEMRLKRIGNTTWPAAGAIGPR